MRATLCAERLFHKRVSKRAVMQTNGVARSVLELCGRWATTFLGGPVVVPRYGDTFTYMPPDVRWV